MFVHLVYFWLKEGTPDSVRQAMIADATHNLLNKIPSVRHVWAGRPAMTPREIVDNSYDVGLCVIYDDRAGHDAYQVHELHQQFMANHRPNWKKVVVYDFV